MAGYTPPKIEDAPKSFIGIGTRELVIRKDMTFSRHMMILLHTTGCARNAKIAFLMNFEKRKNDFYSGLIMKYAEKHAVF